MEKSTWNLPALLVAAAAASVACTSLANKPDRSVTCLSRDLQQAAGRDPFPRNDVAAIVELLRQKLTSRSSESVVDLDAPTAAPPAPDSGKPSPAEAMRRTESTHLRTPLKGERKTLAVQVEQLRRRLAEGANESELRRLAADINRDAGACPS